MTVIGRSDGPVPHRRGGKAGDALWLIGTVGDAAAGLALLSADPKATGALIDIYRRPVPQLSAGHELASRVHAMMDVSDGLLLDSLRLAEASGCSAMIELDALPLSRAFVAERGQDLSARLFAASGGDDYALLAALPPSFDPETLSLPSGTRINRIGSLTERGARLSLTFDGDPVELPERLGFEHQSYHDRGLSASPMADRP